MQATNTSIFENYSTLKAELGILTIPWKLDGKNKKESYSNKHYDAKEQVEGYTAGNPFLHDIDYYKVINKEQWGVRLPSRVHLEKWYQGDYILLLGDCDFLKGEIPEGEKTRAKEVMAALNSKGEKSIQTKVGIPEQFHSFMWVHKDILKHLSGVQFKIPLGEARKTKEGKLKKSVVELFFAGKFLRCGKDYQGDLDFYNLPKISATKFLSLVDHWETWGMNREKIHSCIKEAKVQRAYTKDLEGSDSIQKGIYKNDNHLKLIMDKIFDKKIAGYNQGRAFLQYVKAHDHHTGNDSTSLLMEVLKTITSSPDGLLRGYADTKYSNQHKEAIQGLFTGRVTADYKVVVKKYLGESETVKKAIREDDRTLIVAPTGTGKSFTAVQVLDEEEENFIFSVPSNSMKEQMQKDYGVRAAGGKGGYSLQKAINDKETRISCCYESFRYLLKVKDEDLKKYVLVVDEVHSILNDINFRDNIKLIRLLDKFKRVIFITATPETVLMKTVKKVIEIERTWKPKINFYLVRPEGKNWNKTQYRHFTENIERIFQGKEPVWFCKSNKKYFEDDEIIFSDNRGSMEGHQDFINSKLKNSLYTTTEIYNAGINIKNKGNFNMILDLQGANLNKIAIQQLIGRPREAKESNVFVFDRGRDRKPVRMDFIKKLALKHIDNLNKGGSLAGMLEVNQIFKEAIFFLDGEWGLDELGLEIALHKYNTASMSSESIIKELGHEIKKVITIKELEEELGAAKEELTPKKLLNTLLNEENEDDFFSYLVARKNGYDIKLYSIPEAIRREVNRDIDLKNTIDRIIKSSLDPNTTAQDVKKVIYKYLGRGAKFENVTIKDIEGCKAEIIALGETSKRMTAVLKILTRYSLEVIDTGNIKPSKVKGICKEKLGLKFKQVKSIVYAIEI